MEPRRFERRHGPREYEGLQCERLSLQLSGNQWGFGVVAHRRSGDRSFCMFHKGISLVFHITRFVTKFVCSCGQISVICRLYYYYYYYYCYKQFYPSVPLYGVRRHGLLLIAGHFSSSLRYQYSSVLKRNHPFLCYSTRIAVQ
jgi:hypothetical protein